MKQMATTPTAAAERRAIRSSCALAVHPSDVAAMHVDIARQQLQAAKGAPPAQGMLYRRMITQGDRLVPALNELIAGRNPLTKLSQSLHPSLSSAMHEVQAYCRDNNVVLAPGLLAEARAISKEARAK